MVANLAKIQLLNSFARCLQITKDEGRNTWRLEEDHHQEWSSNQEGLAPHLQQKRGGIGSKERGQNQDCWLGEGTP